MKLVRRFAIASAALVIAILMAEAALHLDLHPALEDAIRRGIDIQESKGDSWHPSAALAAEFAQALVKSELLP